MIGRQLIIAPHTDLEYASAEVQHIANSGLPTVHLLINDVTIRSVVDALAIPFDTIWFIAHGSREGIQLEDGVLTSSILIQLLRKHPPKLLVINSCSSFALGVRAYKALRCAVVATIIDVPDRLAYITAGLLAESLASGKDIEQAYEESRPHEDREYMLLNGSIQLNSKSQVDNTNRLVLRLFVAIDEVRDQITDMQRRPRHANAVAVIGWLFLLLPSILFLQLSGIGEILDSRSLLWTVIMWTIAALCFGYSLDVWRKK